MCNGDFTEIVKLSQNHLNHLQTARAFPHPMVESAQEQRTIGIPVSTVAKNFFFSLLWILRNLYVKKIPRLAVSVVLSLLVHFPLVLHHTGEKANA